MFAALKPLTKRKHILQMMSYFLKT